MIKQEDSNGVVKKEPLDSIHIKVESILDLIPKLEPVDDALSLPNSTDENKSDATSQTSDEGENSSDEGDNVSDETSQTSDEGDKVSDETSNTNDEGDNTSEDINDTKNVENQETSMFLCKCGVQFDGKRQLQGHIWKEHVDATLRCNACSVCFCSQQALHAHSKKVHGTRCQLCSFRGRNSTEINIHKQHVHERWTCDKCAFQTYFKGNWQRHVDISHTFKCKTCSFQTNSKFALRKHKEQVHRKTLYCDNCSFHAQSTMQLRRHKKNKHPKRYSCQNCTSYSTHWLSRLNAHQKICPNFRI